MSHSICMLLGDESIIRDMTFSTAQNNIISLSRDLAILELTDWLLEDINELGDNRKDDPFEEFDFFSAAVREYVLPYTYNNKIAYIEADSFTGEGRQAAVIFENYKVFLGPLKCERFWSDAIFSFDYRPPGKGAVNCVLEAMGVRCVRGMDEAGSVGLDRCWYNG